MSVNEKRPNVRHFIFQWRKFRHLSQESLAAKVGTTASAISQLEHGKQGYSQPMLEALAVALNTDPGSLLGRDPRDPEGINSIWEKLSADDRRRALAIIKVLPEVPQD